MSKFVYRHFVPKKPLDESFPFLYKLSVTTEIAEPDIEFDSVISNKDTAETQQQKIHEELIKKFNFFKYLNKYSPNYKKFPELTLKINRVIIEKVKSKIVRTVKDIWYLKVTNFESEYSYNLITNIKDLKEVLKEVTKVSFDTETTGLNPEEDYIVGVSLATKRKEGYYVPIAHDIEFEKYNLGIEALEVIYEALTKANLTYMFNARFDMRMMEFTKHEPFFDMLKVKTNDVQINTHFADPEFRRHDLKYMEEHFLGYKRPDLKETMSLYGSDIFNFKFINPELALFYAAQDAISTFELGEETYRYYKEFGIAGEIDQTLLPIIMRYENYANHIDTKFIDEQLEYLIPRLRELDEEIKSHIGEINLNSSKQKADLLTSFGLDTGEKTKGGAMATGIPAILKMIDRLKAEGKKYPAWLELFEERAKLDKSNNTFFGRLGVQAKENNNRIRINYRLGVTATGRLSSGKEDNFE